MSNDESRGEKVQPAWCIAANVVYERECGPGGLEKRKGTKHFAPGAKVYLVKFYWDSGGADVLVVGRHRKSHRYITIVTRTKWLANWRVELVHSPRIIKEVVKHKAYTPKKKWFHIWPFDENPGWAGSPEAKAQAERSIVACSYFDGPASKTQPPVMRTGEKSNPTEENRGDVGND